MTEADVLTRLLHAIDALDWAGVRDALAGEILVDYSSLSGGEAETLSADDLIARWRSLLPGFDATQHLTGPVLVTNDGGPGVRADTHVIGYHRLDEAERAQTKQAQSWVVHGHYTARLVAGKITELTLTVFFIDGDLDLPRLATEHAASGLGRGG
jgi:SnoaL-like domain